MLICSRVTCCTSEKNFWIQVLRINPFFSKLSFFSANYSCQTYSCQSPWSTSKKETCVCMSIYIYIMYVIITVTTCNDNKNDKCFYICTICKYMGVSKNRGIWPPKWMVYFMENPIKMDDFGGVLPPLFLETPICWSLQPSNLPNPSIHKFPLKSPPKDFHPNPMAKSKKFLPQGAFCGSFSWKKNWCPKNGTKFFQGKAFEFFWWHRFVAPGFCLLGRQGKWEIKTFRTFLSRCWLAVVNIS